MTQDQLPEHLLLAVAANRLTGLHAPISKFDCTRIAEEIANLRACYAAARLEIESLHAQLEAIGAGGVEPLRKSAQAAPVAPDVSGYIAEWRGGICTAEEAMQGIAKLYAAMLAAAPQPPAEAQEPVGRFTGRFWTDDAHNRMLCEVACNVVPTAGALLYTGPATQPAAPKERNARQQAKQEARMKVTP